MTKYAMATEAEAIGSYNVDQNFYIQFLLHNIDKIKRATLYVVSNLVLLPIFGKILIIPESSILQFFGKLFAQIYFKYIRELGFVGVLWIIILESLYYLVKVST